MQVMKFKSLQIIRCRCLQKVRKTAPRTIHHRSELFSISVDLAYKTGPPI